MVCAKQPMENGGVSTVRPHMSRILIGVTLPERHLEIAPPFEIERHIMLRTSQSVFARRFNLHIEERAGAVSIHFEPQHPPVAGVAIGRELSRRARPCAARFFCGVRGGKAKRARSIFQRPFADVDRHAGAGGGPRQPGRADALCKHE